jgi:hypothetical protein
VRWDAKARRYRVHVLGLHAMGAADFSAGEGALPYQSYVSGSQLVWVDRRGGEVATIGPADVNGKSARLSPDGRWVATAVYDGQRGEQDCGSTMSKPGRGGA